MIFGLFAIPVLSVTSVALAADVASTTDPTAALVGIPATLAGLVTGALVFRLARVAHSGAVAVRAVFAALFVGVDHLVVSAAGAFLADAIRRPALVLVPARVGRRGPPVLRR
jgi:hypothetical protein